MLLHSVSQFYFQAVTHSFKSVPTIDKKSFFISILSKLQSNKYNFKKLKSKNLNYFATHYKEICETQVCCDTMVEKPCSNIYIGMNSMIRAASLIHFVPTFNPKCN